MERTPSAPVITLTTDFGLSDHYVGTMKGVILSRCPGVRIVDICHEVLAFSVWAGAYTISQSAPYFPAGSVHVVVVDPGVGTSRKPILAESSGQYFVAPDNGVLSLILDRDPAARIREITNRELFLPAVSSTFHGRDVFAPAAAALASGMVVAEDVGPSLKDPIMLEDIHPHKPGSAPWQGRVLSVDHFGNVITNFPAQNFLPARVHAGGREVDSVRETFGEAQPAEIFLYGGSSGYIEIGINQGRAAELLKLAPGDSITLTD
jgi:S-adenosylmethionine hydrolase